MKIENIINEIREEKIGIAKIVLCNASAYVKNAIGEMTYAGTLFSKKHVAYQIGDDVIKTGSVETNLSQVLRTLSALANKGNVEVRFLNGKIIKGEIEEEL